MRLLIAAATALTLTTTFASAEKWGFESATVGNKAFYAAFQIDESGDFVLSVECYEGSPPVITVATPFLWDQTASYAPDVPATFVIDGAEISDVLFYFDFSLDGEDLVAFPDGQEAAFRGLIEAFGSARDTIALSYFDKSASFSADGATEALFTLLDGCI